MGICFNELGEGSLVVQQFRVGAYLTDPTVNQDYNKVTLREERQSMSH